MPIITEHEMDRRRAMAAAKCDITEDMDKHGLTVMELVDMSQVVTQRVIQCGLKEDWQDESSSP